MTMLHNYLTFSTNLEMMNYYLLPRVSLLFVEHISFSFIRGPHELISHKIWDKHLVTQSFCCQILNVAVAEP